MGVYSELCIILDCQNQVMKIYMTIKSKGSPSTTHSCLSILWNNYLNTFFKSKLICFWNLFFHQNPYVCKWIWNLNLIFRFFFTLMQSKYNQLLLARMDLKKVVFVEQHSKKWNHFLKYYSCKCKTSDFLMIPLNSKSFLPNPLFHLLVASCVGCGIPMEMN